MRIALIGQNNGSQLIARNAVRTIEDSWPKLGMSTRTAAFDGLEDGYPGQTGMNRRTLRISTIVIVQYDSGANAQPLRMIIPAVLCFDIEYTPTVARK